MMVPRAFLFASAPFKTGAIRREKDPASLDTAAIYQPSHESHESSSTSDHVVADATVVIHTNPVIIPPKRSVRRIPGQNVNTGGRLRNGPARSTSLRRSSSAHTIDREIPASVASLLEVTAIPLRKNSTVRSSRRLPGKYAEDFSRLMSEGTKARDGNATPLDGSGQSPLDFLLSPPEEDNEKSRSTNDFGSETPFSIRSMSTDSIPSLDHDLDSFMTSEPATPSLSGQRRFSERRKQFSPPEECATNHPLLEVEEIESIDSFFPSPEDVPVPSKQTTISFRSFPRLGSTFKSNLTASLRAIKSAAQSVSNFTTPSVQPEDFLTRSLFSINPELTDDRRPLPMSGPPSPALRRYLNPIALSPAEMHVYHESQDLNQSIHNSPVSIQMQTYHPSGSPSRRGRFTTGNASGKDHSVCLFDPELPPSRQREPRENSDFLRMVVLEMNMRRSGKLRDDIPTRAKIWLPPRQPVLSSGDYGDDEPSVPQRWVGASIECS